MNMLRPDEFMLLLDDMTETVSTPAMFELDREMTPILAELATLGPGNNEHSAAKQLFNWLVDSQRTGDEFLYAIGPLQNHISKIMVEHFKEYVYEVSDVLGGEFLECYDGSGAYLCKVALEALAVINPVIKGPWEQAAWKIAKDNIENLMNYAREDYGPCSARLSAWIIQQVGDHDLNSYIRIDLVYLFYIMYNDFSEPNLTLTVESVLSASYYLTIDCQESGYGYFQKMGSNRIIRTLAFLIMHGFLKTFDNKLAKQLLDVKILRLEDVIHDVAYAKALDSSRYTQSVSLRGLTALLTTISKSAKLVSQHDEEMAEKITSLCAFLITYFIKSCQTPQLVGLAARSIRDVRTLTSLFISEDRFNHININMEQLKKVLDKNDILLNFV